MRRAVQYLQRAGGWSPAASMAAVAFLGLMGCGSDAGGDVCGNPDGTEVYVDVTAPACDQLSSYRFFTGLASRRHPRAQ
jgi:hypothetical protein